MALCTLAEAKIHLGIGIPTADTTEDTRLQQFIRGASGAIRKYCHQYFGGLITSNTLANPTVVTAPGHGLVTGDTVNFAGSNSTPVLAGLLAVTRIDQDTFSVPVNVTVAGTAAYWSKQYTEYYNGTGRNTFTAKQRPVNSITSLYLDSTGFFGKNPSGAFDVTTTVLVEGTDFVLNRDNANQTEVSLSGKIFRIGNFWPTLTTRSLGLLSGAPGNALGNIKMTYVAGWMPIPDDLRMAACEYVRVMRRGPGTLSETYDYYTYSLDPAADRDNVLGGVRNLLSGYKKLIW